jgi:hypothetical protein
LTDVIFPAYTSARIEIRLFSVLHGERSQALIHGSHLWASSFRFFPMAPETEVNSVFPFAPERQTNLLEGSLAVKRILGSQQTCRSLTILDAAHRVSLSSRSQGLRDTGLDCDASPNFHGSNSHSRDVYLLQHVLYCAGVYAGLDSEAISDPRRPTRYTARWVFCFGLVRDLPNSLLNAHDCNMSLACVWNGAAQPR